MHVDDSVYAALREVAKQAEKEVDLHTYGPSFRSNIGMLKRALKDLKEAERRASR